jgi:Gas vesicle protein
MTELVRARESAVRPPEQPPASLVDLLDRLLAKGVVVAGEVTLSIADVDLVHISLRALITSVRTRASIEATEEEPA